MYISTPPFEFERRDQPRRSADREEDHLHKTFSTPHCHACLKRMADGVLLLDNETRVIFATPQINQIMKRQDVPFTLSPKFSLHPPQHAAKFAAFVNGKDCENGPLRQLLEGQAVDDLLLLNCVQFPTSTEPKCRAARYMIIMFEPNHCPSQQWLFFKKQFNLTPAEARLCRSFADGLTLNDYCEKWKVAPSTARSQLHIVFGKTSTRRQSDLLRLIFLFSRN
ncbi:MAG: helix-turn-helix transcriptional regulator [Methylococcaceae bacterium]|nr:helix-turn-helix transcriptional regulator [Methylococcaceae bacterium]